MRILSYSDNIRTKLKNKRYPWCVIGAYFPWCVYFIDPDFFPFFNFFHIYSLGFINLETNEYFRKRSVDATDHLEQIISSGSVLICVRKDNFRSPYKYFSILDLYDILETRRFIVKKMLTIDLGLNYSEPWIAHTKKLPHKNLQIFGSHIIGLKSSSIFKMTFWPEEDNRMNDLFFGSKAKRRRIESQ